MCAWACYVWSSAQAAPTSSRRCRAISSTSRRARSIARSTRATPSPRSWCPARDRASRSSTSTGRRSEPVRLLVLGGTQFLGRAVVDAALAEGHDVTLFNRGLTNPGLHPTAEHLRGNLESDLGALRGRR